MTLLIKELQKVQYSGITLSFFANEVFDMKISGPLPETIIFW